MTDTTVSELWVNAIAAGQTSTYRVASGACHRQSSTALGGELFVTSQRGLRGSERVGVYDDKGTHYEAELVGSDEALDVALLRAAGAEAQAPGVVEHAALRTGQLVFALGRPGANIRASQRIIGLLGEAFRTPRGGQLDRYIESDRGLPDGFEGGPLIDEQGRVIGMNSSSVLPGADLSVPHATLARSVAELLAHGRIRRGYLGVACQTVRLPAAVRGTLSQRSGALVLDTEDGGPAQAAGLALGDVIVSLDGTPIRGPRELLSTLRDKRGALIDLGILRQGQLQHLAITAAERL